MATHSATGVVYPVRPRKIKLTGAQREAGCFYCGRLGGRLDGDHAPIPHRHGGDVVVPACKHCHELKDSLSPRKWSPAEHEAVERGASLPAVVVMSYCAATVNGDDVELDPGTVMSAVDTCTTAEAKVAVLRSYNAALDAAKKAAARLDGKSQVPGCRCDEGGRSCPFPCWQRVGITEDPCCKACSPLPEVDA